MDLRNRLATLSLWLGLGAVVGALCGVSAAGFLWLLDRATGARTSHAWIIYALPLGGWVIGWCYERVGKPIKDGSNLVIDTIYDTGLPLPLRMAPMVMLGTVLTHLVGGSAGREGTAVQMGASLADGVAQRVRVGSAMRRQLMIAGVAGGFAAVFGTPWAGVVFGLEWLAFRRLRVEAVVPAVVAALVGNAITRLLGTWIGVAHTPFLAAPHVAFSPRLALMWGVFAVAIALTAIVFIELTSLIKRQAERRIKRLPWRLACGGAVLVGLWLVVGSSDYMGLGVPLMLRAFQDPTLPTYAFALKLGFTAVTLGAGFIGGEVTPLFCIGATLGGVLAQALGMPMALGAGVGMAAMFAAAANVPLALTVMAVELLGVAILPHVALVCAIAYVVVGRRSIYAAQRVTTKRGVRLDRPTALRNLD